MRYRSNRSETGRAPEYPPINDHPSIDDVTYDARTERTVATLRRSATQLTLVITDLIGAQRGCCATDLAPLYDAVDPEALDRLFDDRFSGSERTVSFEYEGYNVTVSDNAVTLSHVQ